MFSNLFRLVVVSLLHFCYILHRLIVYINVVISGPFKSFTGSMHFIYRHHSTVRKPIEWYTIHFPNKKKQKNVFCLNCLLERVCTLYDLYSHYSKHYDFLVIAFFFVWNHDQSSKPSFLLSIDQNV